VTQSVCQTSEDMNLDEMIQSVCKTAKAGLAEYYANANDPLPYSATIKPHEQLELSGLSVRYAAISQIGIARWLTFHPEDAESLPDLWPRVVNNSHKVTGVGDCALALWAGLATKADNCELFAKSLSGSWRSQTDLCNAVELGWILQACTLALRERDDLELYTRPVLDEVRNRLVGLFKPGQELFQRHNRPGIGKSISRRIACFADQVYPILALSNYGSAFDDKECVEYAAHATEQICRLQGPLGQWWWHYDTKEGRICEEYPVYSVHQDSMAPMAILASDRATGGNHDKEIELGLRWLFGCNELNENLLLNGAGIIWRDIEKREPGKVSRTLRATLCVAGLELLHRFARKCFVGFRINRECRPYHLGWILYAWADYGSES